jgi:hypothetical protein
MVNNRARVAGAMAAGRILIGAAALLAPGPTSRLLGFPTSQDSASARLMGRLFGVRDVALGVLVLQARRNPEFARFVYCLNACVDGGDAASMAVALIGREGIDRAALASSVPALGAMVGWSLLAANTPTPEVDR